MSRLPLPRFPGCLAVAVVLSVPILVAGAASAADKMLVHDVYFSLIDKSADAQEKLVAACKKYLSGHPGTVWFSVATMAPEFARDVNDRDFEVSLQLVLNSKEAHDRYQKSDRHEKFIAECKANWAKVRVFDSYVSGWAHGAAPELPKSPHAPAAHSDAAHHAAPAHAAPHDRPLHLPDPAAHFAGMVQGRVEVLRDHGLVLTVEKVVKQWEHSKAKSAESLVGKKVFINLRSEEGRPAARLVRFVGQLKVGQTVVLDVAHRHGEALTLLELTEEQRKAIGR